MFITQPRSQYEAPLSHVCFPGFKRPRARDVKRVAQSGLAPVKLLTKLRTIRRSSAQLKSTEVMCRQGFVFKSLILRSVHLTRININKYRSGGVCACKEKDDKGLRDYQCHWVKDSKLILACETMYSLRSMTIPVRNENKLMDRAH